MEYIAVTKGSHLSHHGVKGMKWGIRKEDYVTKRGKKKSKLYFDYQKLNKKTGKYEARTTRILKSTAQGIKYNGLVNKNGVAKGTNREKALSYIKAKRAKTIISLAGTAGGLAAGALLGPMAGMSVGDFIFSNSHKIKSIATVYALSSGADRFLASSAANDAVSLANVIGVAAKKSISSLTAAGVASIGAKTAIESGKAARDKINRKEI